VGAELAVRLAERPPAEDPARELAGVS